MRSGYLIAGLVLAIAVVLGLNYFFSQSESDAGQTSVDAQQPAAPDMPPLGNEPGATVMEETPPSPSPIPTPEEPVFVPPPLNASDEFVRERFAQPLAAGAIPEDWLVNEDLLRRLAVVTENAARGEIPRQQLSFLAPDGKFMISQRVVGGGADATEKTALFIDPVSYQRYDRYLDMLEAMDPDSFAAFLTDAYPLLDEALAELGSREAVLPQLVGAIDQLLAVPVIRADIELVQPKVFYEYADPSLEDLSPLQKQALRMGPDNVERLQSYLRILRTELLR